MTANDAFKQAPRDSQTSRMAPFTEVLDSQDCDKATTCQTSVTVNSSSKTQNVDTRSLHAMMIPASGTTENTPCLQVAQEDNLKSCSMTLSPAHQVSNSRQPIFKLPFELLTRIVREALPNPLDQPSSPLKRPLWRSAARNAKALLPVSQTCRWLRQVVLADRMLWQHITTGSRTRQFDQLLLSRSSPTSPLTMVGPGSDPSLPISLTEFHCRLAPRLQELHFLGSVDGSAPAREIMLFLHLPFPLLEMFSLTGSDCKVSRRSILRSPSSLPVSGLNAPRLRYLSLGLTTLLPVESGFPRLTHLALSYITTPNLHNRVTNLLRNCPLLTSLVLRNLRCSTRMATLDFWRPMAAPEPLPSPGLLSRVILADMDPNLVEYYAALFSQQRPCLQIPIFERDPFASREREVFGALYRQYSHKAEDKDVSRLCVATHAVDHSHASDDSSGATRGFSVTLASSTDLLRVSVWPTLLERDPYGRRNWRADILAPLRALAGVREVWLVDMDMISDREGLGGDSTTVPIWNLSDPVQLRVDGARSGVTEALPSLANAIIVHNCLSSLRAAGLIQPSIAVLPTRPRAFGPPLQHLRLAIGYDVGDLPRLRGVWTSSLAAADSEWDSRMLLPEGKVDLTTNLLNALASDRSTYTYVRHAQLVVQVMPHLVLDAEELERLRGFFAAVDVEEIDRLPTMPVPERVRDGVLDLRGFVSGSVVC